MPKRQLKDLFLPASLNVVQGKGIGAGNGSSFEYLKNTLEIFWCLTLMFVPSLVQFFKF
jgi:hypothetical protein